MCDLKGTGNKEVHETCVISVGAASGWESNFLRLGPSSLPPLAYSSGPQRGRGTFVSLGSIPGLRGNQPQDGWGLVGARWPNSTTCWTKSARPQLQGSKAECREPSPSSPAPAAASVPLGLPASTWAPRAL